MQTPQIAGSSAESYTAIKSLEGFPVVCISVVTSNLGICEHNQLHSSHPSPSPPLPFSQFYSWKDRKSNLAIENMCISGLVLSTPFLVVCDSKMLLPGIIREIH